MQGVTLAKPLWSRRSLRAWRSLYGVLRLVGALDFTGGVGRETNRQSQNKCRLARTDHASGVSRRDVVGTPPRV